MALSNAQIRTIIARRKAIAAATASNDNTAVRRDGLLTACIEAGGFDQNRHYA